MQERLGRAVAFLALICCCVAVGSACGGSSVSAPAADTPPDPAPSVRLVSGTTNEAGQVSLASGDVSQTMTLLSELDSGPATGLVVSLAEDGDAATLLIVDPDGKHQPLILDPTDAGTTMSYLPASAVPAALVLRESVFVPERNTQGPRLPKAIATVDSTTLEGLLEPYFVETVRLTQLRDAIEGLVSRWRLDAPFEVISGHVPEDGAGRQQTQVVCWTLTRYTLASAMPQEWWEELYDGRCCLADAELQLYLVPEAPLIVILPRVRATPPVFVLDYAVSGTIRDAFSGAPLAGVTLTMCPGAVVIETDENGFYEIFDVSHWCGDRSFVHCVAAQPGYGRSGLTGIDMKLVHGTPSTYDFNLIAGDATSTRIPAPKEGWIPVPNLPYGDIHNPEHGWDGDFDTYTEADPNWLEAMVWYTEEYYTVPPGATNLRVHGKVETTGGCQSQARVWVWNYMTDVFDPLVDATEQTVPLGWEYVRDGTVRVQGVLFAKHSASCWARYYETEILYDR